MHFYHVVEDLQGSQQGAPVRQGDERARRIARVVPLVLEFQQD
jgi:hypothetical protein